MTDTQSREGMLAGRVALVTGAGQGMGAAHARRLARDGAVVAVNDLTASSALQELADEIGGISVPGDVSDREQVQALVAEIARQVGDVDVLVANHAYMTMAPFLEHDLDDWWKVVDTNLGGTFHLVQAVLPGMRRRWCRTHRRGLQRVGRDRLAGCHGLRRVQGGADLADQDPGPRAGTARGSSSTRWPRASPTPPSCRSTRATRASTCATMHARYAKDIPLGRIATAEEMAEVVALLADFRLSAMIGQVVQANGGSTRSRA